MTSVCSSVRSSGSSKYRRISSQSCVDESLFGSSRASSASKDASRHSKAKSRQQLPSVTDNSQTISLSELQKIKQSATAPVRQSHQTSSSDRDDDTTTSCLGESVNKRAQTEAARARKEYMKELELKELERQSRMGSETDKAKLDKIRKEAQEKMDDNQDIVKLLKTCSERAKTFAIRDQQLKDKAERDEKEQNYEQRMILAMEIDRLREIEAREEEQAQRMKKMIDDRKIIENQIEERTQARLLQEEARDQENRDMLDRIRMYQEQDEERARERRESAAKARTEIMRANEEHIAQKRERKLQEKREDEMMVAYQMEKDEMMRRREAEEAEAERKKREIQKKLLDEQEKMMDRRSEMDELRARRAMEDKERKYRQKQLEEAQKKKRDMDTLDIARKQQQQERYERQQMENEQKREEYENAVQHARTMAERERAEAEYAKRKNDELISNLQSQIEENRERRMELEKEKYQEGSMIKHQLAEERAKLEAVREKMVAEMRKIGIDERYFGEMISLDINKYLLK